MRLPTHDRYAYSPIKGRADYVWPGRKRLAVYIGLNLEHFAFGEGLGAELMPTDTEPDVLNYAWRDYGNCVGVWRMLDLFDALQFPTSALVNTAMYFHCPEVMQAVRRRGDEVVGHGRTNSERQADMDEVSEFALIAETTEVIRTHEGAAPSGWLGPWISESFSTPDILSELGYHYVLDWCMDDQPVWLKTRSGRRFLSVPYPQEINDIPAIVARRHTAADFADMIVDQFDEMLDQSAEGPLVMGIALHPYIMGQPFRLRQLRRALTHIAGRRDHIWLTRTGDIARHAAAAMHATAG